MSESESEPSQAQRDPLLRRPLITGFHPTGTFPTQTRSELKDLRKVGKKWVYGSRIFRGVKLKVACGLRECLLAQTAPEDTVWAVLMAATVGGRATKNSSLCALIKPLQQQHFSLPPTKHPEYLKHPPYPHAPCVESVRRSQPVSRASRGLPLGSPSEPRYYGFRESVVLRARPLTDS